MRTICIHILFVILLSACSSGTSAPAARIPTENGNPIVATFTIPPPLSTPSPQQVEKTGQSSEGKCSLEPFVAPTMPATIPETTKLDETTGLHMTGKVQVIDLATYRLVVGGKVDYPLSLSLDELRCMPKIRATSDLTCYGVFNDSGTWAGVPIKYVLEQAGIQAGAKTVVFKSSDDFQVTMTLEEALGKKNFLAYEMEGKPLPILHGFPLRAVFPDAPGGRWVKWLVEITIE